MKLTKKDLESVIYNGIMNKIKDMVVAQIITEKIMDTLIGSLTNIDNPQIVIMDELDIQNLCGILSYDIALNKAAKKLGYHPVSHFVHSEMHDNFAHRNERLIRMFGYEVMDIPKDLIFDLVSKDEEYSPLTCPHCNNFLLVKDIDNKLCKVISSYGMERLVCPKCGDEIEGAVPMEEEATPDSFSCLGCGEELPLKTVDCPKCGAHYTYVEHRYME